VALLVAPMLVAKTASADESGVLVTRHHSGVSPQNFLIEARIGLYENQIDSDPKLGGKNPAASTFGTDPRFEVGMEFDWQALRIPDVGSLGPGFALAYTVLHGCAIITGTTQCSAEQTGLEILPMYLVAVFRLDVLQEKLHVPLVPYAKAGLGYALWRGSNSAGTSTYGGVIAEGGTFGTQLAGGVAFNLGVFDPNTAHQLDESTGINNTYAFVEYYSSDLNGLWQSNVLRVGSRNVAFGLSFEF
jgi:hypothetical protein